MGCELAGVIWQHGSRGRRRSKSFEHFKRHVILKDFYFYTCCMGVYAGTGRAYIPMEYVMHTDLHGSRGATPPSLSHRGGPIRYTTVCIRGR
jgi:hypothetical protein